MTNPTAAEEKGSMWKPFSNTTAVHLGFVVDKLALGQDSLSTVVLPCQYHSTNVVLSFHSTTSNIINGSN